MLQEVRQNFLVAVQKGPSLYPFKVYFSTLVVLSMKFWHLANQRVDPPDVSIRVALDFVEVWKYMGPILAGKELSQSALLSNVEVAFTHLFPHICRCVRGNFDHRTSYTRAQSLL